jgi:hypothetical protein
MLPLPENFKLGSKVGLLPRITIMFFLKSYAVVGPKAESCKFANPRVAP